MSNYENIINTTNKKATYQALLPQIKALTAHETNTTANLANITAAIKQAFNFLWVGFYKANNQTDLILANFQGPPACTRIAYGKGVCGTAWAKKISIIVPDVNEFPGHIACSNKSKSEIVICVMKNKEVCYVLDIDSDKLNDFDETDLFYLEKLCNEIIVPIL